MLELKMEIRTWKNKETGEVRQYPSYYVEYQGIKINMSPSDQTGNQLLNMLFGYKPEGRSENE